MENKNENRPLYIAWGILFSIFVIEFISHIIVSKIDSNSFYYKYSMFIDSFILIIFLSPFLYRYVFKTLKTEITLSDSIQRLLDEKIESECDLKESEKQYRLLFEDNPMPMCVYDLETFAFLAINDSAVQFYGYSKDEAKTMTLKDIHMPEDWPSLFELIQKIPSGINKAGIWRHVKKDGTVVFVEVTTHAILFEGRRARLAMANDVTDKLKMEESLKESEERFRTAFDEAPIGMTIVGLDLRYVQVNNAFCAMTGYKKSKLVGLHISDITYHDDIIKDAGYVKLVTDGEVTGYDAEKRYIHADGHVIWTKVNVSSVYDDEGRLKYFIGQIEDITEMRAAEESFRKTYETLNSVINASPLSILVIDPDFKIKVWNPEAERMFGWKADEVIGKPLPFIPGEKQNEFLALKERVLHGGQLVGIETLRNRKDGSQIHISLSTASVYDKSGGVKEVIAMMSDITERKKADEALRESEKNLRTLFDSATDGIIILDMQGFFVDVNKTLYERLGYTKEEMLSMHIKDIDTPEFAERVPERLEQIKREGHATFESAHFKKDGAVMPIEISCRMLEYKGQTVYFSVIRDITERKKTEALIYQAKQDWEDTFNSLTDMITVHDKNYDIIRANKAAEKILGLPLLTDMKGKCFKFYHGTDAPPAGCPSCECLKTGVAATFEIFEPHLDKFIEINSIPRYNKENQMVGLIHVVRDITEKKKAQDLIKNQLERLNVLRTIDMAISSSLDLKLTLEIILQQAVSQLHVDSASILIYNKFSQRLEYSASIGFRDARIKKTSLRLGVGYAGKVAYEKRTITVFDKNELSGEFGKASLIKEEGFMAYAGVPLIAKGEIKGVFEVFHRSVLTPDPEWLDFVEALAGQAAIAIDNATMFGDLQKSNVELIMAYDSTIEGWSRAMDFRDKETEGHSRRVTDLTVKIANEMQINEEEIIHIRRGALLHDIGKLGVPDSILLKPGKLTDEEWVIMKNHPVIAYEILSPIPFLKEALDIPYCHHEKWDGTGYPRGLKGEQIPLSARIFAVVDVWDALRSDRPYRPAWSEDKTIEHIKALSGTHFDPAVLELFIKAIY